MRAFTSGWVGRRVNDTNMTISGEAYANEIITLFNRSNTLSEFNSGTYTGVSMYGLTLWSKYLPSSSVMTQMGPVMIKHTWEAVAELWHPDLKNVAGPWDRSYGFDMNRYLSLLALHLWNIIGKENSSILPNVTSPAPLALHSLTWRRQQQCPTTQTGPTVPPPIPSHTPTNIHRPAPSNTLPLPQHTNPHARPRKTKNLPRRTHIYLLHLLPTLRSLPPQHHRLAR